jgi:hypothetical protein
MFHVKLFSQKKFTVNVVLKTPVKRNTSVYDNDRKNLKFSTIGAFNKGNL